MAPSTKTAPVRAVSRGGTGCPFPPGEWAERASLGVPAAASLPPAPAAPPSRALTPEAGRRGRGGGESAAAEAGAPEPRAKGRALEKTAGRRQNKNTDGDMGPYSTSKGRSPSGNNQLQDGEPVKGSIPAWVKYMLNPSAYPESKNLWYKLAFPCFLLNPGLLSMRICWKCNSIVHSYSFFKSQLQYHLLSEALLIIPSSLPSGPPTPGISLFA